MTVLWALEHFEQNYQALVNSTTTELSVYTDSKTIAELSARRTRLEQAQFKSGRTGMPLSNGDLYQKFYMLTDRLKVIVKLEFIWVKGHSKRQTQTREQAIFSRVDHAARSELRRDRF